jgi:hypothetical protein
MYYDFDEEDDQEAVYNSDSTESSLVSESPRNC